MREDLHLGILAPHPAVTGHYPEYLRHFSGEAIARGWGVSIVTSDALREYIVSVMKAPVEAGRLRAHAVAFPPLSPERRARVRPIGAQAWNWLGLKKAFREVRSLRCCDHILILDGDHVCRAIGLLGLPFRALSVSAILFSDALSHEKRYSRPALVDTVSRIAFRSFLRNRSIRAVITTNPLLDNRRADLPPHLSEKIRYVHEIGPAWSTAVDNGAARASLGIPDNLRVVLCYGALDPHRKGVIDLLECLQFPEFGDVALLAVGSPTSKMSDLMLHSGPKRLKEQGRLITRLGYAPTELEQLAFSAADVVWLAYRDFYGPSGVLELACAAGVPIVGNNKGVIGHLIETEHLGVAADLSSHESVREALRKCLRDERVRMASIDACRSHASGNGSQTFAARVCDIVERATRRNETRTASSHA